MVSECLYLDASMYSKISGTLNTHKDFTRTRLWHVELCDLGRNFARLVVDDGLVLLWNVSHCVSIDEI